MNDKKFTVQKSAILSVSDSSGALCAVVFTDTKTRHKVFHSTKEMGIEDIESLLQEIGENGICNMPNGEKRIPSTSDDL